MDQDQDQDESTWTWDDDNNMYDTFLNYYMTREQCEHQYDDYSYGRVQMGRRWGTDLTLSEEEEDERKEEEERQRKQKKDYDKGDTMEVESTDEGDKKNKYGNKEPAVGFNRTQKSESTTSGKIEQGFGSRSIQPSTSSSWSMPKEDYGNFFNPSPDQPITKRRLSDVDTDAEMLEMSDVIGKRRKMD